MPQADQTTSAGAPGGTRPDGDGPDSSGNDGRAAKPARHAARSGWGRPFGPHNTSRWASCIAWSTRIPAEMHRPWNACRTSPSTASTCSGAWIETERG